MPIKPIQFAPYGPFKLIRENGAITQKTLETLWHEDGAGDVALGIGVYIIAVVAGNDLIPWYVGKTDKGFKKRFYQHSRSVKHIFARLAKDLPSEELVVMFLARHTSVRNEIKRARKPSAATKTSAVATIGRLEYDILRKALEKNPRLFNKSTRMYMQMLSVPGMTDLPSKEEQGAPKKLRRILKK